MTEITSKTWFTGAISEVLLENPINSTGSFVLVVLLQVHLVQALTK